MPLPRLFPALADLLMPARCAGCGQAGGLWCAGCRRRSRGRGREVVRHVEGCRQVVVGGRYEGPLRQAVLALKRDRPYLAAVLARDLWPGRLPAGVDCVTWVPAGPGRRRRGFDQGRTLAHAAAALLNCPARCLLARRGQRGQRDLRAEERRLNAATAIAAAGRLPGWHVLIVDDVVTTGASLSCSAQALRAAGVREVDAAVLAAVPELRLPRRSRGDRPPELVISEGLKMTLKGWLAGAEN